ncbi:MAG: hypothetical protein OEM41_03255, partial [Ignavibacteria bacterium]|nr:hypothetical protein [Ignavibacteria bacterium]
VIDTPGEQTGVLFHEQSVEAILAALARFRGLSFSPDLLHRGAQRFAREKFKAGMRDFVQERWAEFRERIPSTSYKRIR